MKTQQQLYLLALRARGWQPAKSTSSRYQVLTHPGQPDLFKSSGIKILLGSNGSVRYTRNSITNSTPLRDATKAKLLAEGQVLAASHVQFAGDSLARELGL